MAISKVPSDISLRIYDNYVIPDYVPVGAVWDEMTKEEQKRVLDAYRFSGFRPSKYQILSGSGRALL